MHGYRTGGDDVLVDHHEGEPAVTVERMPLVEVEDRLLLVRGEPVVSGDPAVVLVGLPVPFLPGVELAPLETEPRDESGRRNLGSLGPLGGEVDDTVAHVGVNPARNIQGTPSFFLSLTCSSVTQAMTASFFATCFSRASTFASRALAGRRAPSAARRWRRSRRAGSASSRRGWVECRSPRRVGRRGPCRRGGGGEGRPSGRR